MDINASQCNHLQHKKTWPNWAFIIVQILVVIIIALIKGQTVILTFVA